VLELRVDLLNLVEDLLRAGLLRAEFRRFRRRPAGRRECGENEQERRRDSADQSNFQLLGSIETATVLGRRPRSQVAEASN
jgi:hypothetical protein